MWFCSRIIEQNCRYHEWRCHGDEAVCKTITAVYSLTAVSMVLKYIFYVRCIWLSNIRDVHGWSWDCLVIISHSINKSTLFLDTKTSHSKTRGKLWRAEVDRNWSKKCSSSEWWWVVGGGGLNENKQPSSRQSIWFPFVCSTNWAWNLIKGVRLTDFTPRSFLFHQLIECSH